MLKCIGILAHPHRPQTAPVAERLVTALQAHGIETWHRVDWDENRIDGKETIACADMVIAIGGDGAMLKAARVCAPYKVPVLGIHMGRLGFLTEIADPEDTSYIQRLLDSDYWIETRMMIQACVIRGSEIIITGEALNDVVISGGQIGRMVQLDTYIDTRWTTTYNADALIIATPTGSTAYALAVGGPILPPDLANILIVPSAAHLSMDRPIVLSEGSQVDVRAATNNRNPVMMMVDGRHLAELADGDIIHITASQHSARFVRMRGRNYFYRSLLDRLEPRVSRAENSEERVLILPDNLSLSSDEPGDSDHD